MSDFLADFLKNDDSKNNNSDRKKLTDKKNKRNESSDESTISDNDSNIDYKYLNKDETIKVRFVYKNITEEIIVPKFKNTYLALINKSIILYGPSGTGKTVIVKDFMHFVKKQFPIVFAFVPTNEQKHDYDSLIPKQLVFEEFGLKEIKDIYLRQKAISEIYNIANNINTLNLLFIRIASPKAKIFLRKLLYIKHKALKEADKINGDASTIKRKKDEIEEIFKEKVIKFYKYVINPNAKKLQNMDLSQEEKYALKYRNLNPKALILFDDASTEIISLIKLGKKNKDETIKNFFFKGRWANITHWYAIHDDTGLDSDIRKNAFKSIFTDKQTALGFFNRSANSFSAIEKKRAEAVINVIFSKEAPPFAKLMYSRLDKNNFQYVVAKEYADSEVQLCSKTVRDFCEKIANKEKLLESSTNPYIEKFKI